MLNWIMYEGGKRSLQNLVEDLVSPYKGKSYIISMDRFYTTLNVAQCLTDNGFGVYGAIMKTRARIGGNMMLKISSLDRFESIFYKFLDSTGCGKRITTEDKTK